MNLLHVKFLLDIFNCSKNHC